MSAEELRAGIAALIERYIAEDYDLMETVDELYNGEFTDKLIELLELPPE